MPLAKAITFCGQATILICDGQCNKAWGLNSRPKDRHDHGMLAGVLMYKSDSEAGDAPLDPGTEEGGDSKPTSPNERLNKWCARECERSTLSGVNEEFVIPDWSTRRTV